MRFASALLATALFGITIASEFKIEVYEGPTDCADEEKIHSGHFVRIHYSGKIDESSATGQKGLNFDSSRWRNKPFEFQMGAGRVLEGWERGFMGMCKGAKAIFIIPPELGYGDVGAGEDVVPGGATLHFDVEVLDILDEGTEPPQANIFEMIDDNGDGKLSEDEVEDFFEGQGANVPDGLWEEEDANGDGFISWEEFNGPKGNSPGGDEL
uniref:peptidylprolyl isomerase n=1 Tax=Ditylum brightwellii TaxID=49249 RepID=A0A6V2QRQ7_9STRA|mmetsp:Transcript_36245/g.48569  ORF Transcript_36245/g.48569 Transcript_36245/m.48569 type:complete len:211 (-) Transcript_36245:630-1262(-)